MDENLFQGNKREREGGLGSTICLIIFRSGFLFCYFYCAKMSIIARHWALSQHHTLGAKQLTGSVMISIATFVCLGLIL